jgi:hypothetical protein
MFSTTPMLVTVIAATATTEALATAPTNAIRLRLVAGRLDGGVELRALDTERRSQTIQVSVAVPAVATVCQRWRSQHGDTS